jgi:hypothetical protein
MTVVYQTEPKRFRIEEQSDEHESRMLGEEDWEYVNGANDYEGAELTVRRLEIDNPTSIYRIVDTEAGA